MHSIRDFLDQKIDSVCYVTCRELVQRSGASRTKVFNDIKSGKLKAIWGKAMRNGHYSRAWLIHPDDAATYIRAAAEIGKQMGE